MYNLIAQNPTRKRDNYTPMRDRNQVVLPIDLEICISKEDFVFTVAEICDNLCYEKLFEVYIRKWRKLNPITLFEIVLFAYMERKFSSREIVKACKTDIRFMWLLNGEPVPSVATVKRFLSEKLTDVVEDLFYQFVEKLYEMGEVKYQNLFVDGTKIEANANKYTFVWKKAVEKNLVSLNKKIDTRIAVICERYDLTIASLEECYETLMQRAVWIELNLVHGKGKHKTQLQKDIEELGGYIKRKEEYLKHLGRMRNRNSYSKTDTDATFMRLKEDHMRNGRLKPGYNIQIGVEGEYIVGFGAFSNRTDVQTLIPFLNRIKSYTKRTFQRIIADAGYESRENYIYLEENKQESYIKPTNYEISKTRKYKADLYSIDNMTYNKEADTYTCANGDTLFFAYERTETTSHGYEVKTRYYRNQSCEGCPHAGMCHKSKRGFREIKISPEFMRQRQKSLDNITTKEGTQLRINRSIQVEGVFGVLKQDFGFKRFLVRGKKNIETQFFMLALAFNVEKLCNKRKNGRFGQDLFPLKTE